MTAALQWQGASVSFSLPSHVSNWLPKKMVRRPIGTANRSSYHHSRLMHSLSLAFDNRMVRKYLPACHTFDYQPFDSPQLTSTLAIFEKTKMDFLHQTCPHPNPASRREMSLHFPNQLFFNTLCEYIAFYDLLIKNILAEFPWCTYTESLYQW